MTTSVSRFRIFVRDRPTVAAGDMPLVGEIDTFLSFEATNRHNDIGAWQLKMTAGAPGTELIQPGRGIVVFGDDEPNWPIFSGPLTQIDSAWSKDDGGTVTVTGPCDNAILRERIARIDPDRDTGFEAEADNVTDIVPTAWNPMVYDFIDNQHYTYRAPNNTGEWIWSLITFNFTNYWYQGDSDESRVVRHLKVAQQLPPEIKALPNDTAWQGFPINMSDLSTVLFQAAEAAGLALRIRWQPRTRSAETTNARVNGLFLSIAPIEDLSEEIVFGPQQGNLSAYTLSSVAPEATRMFIEAETTENDRRWLGYRKNTLFDPQGWISWDSRNSNGEHYLAAQWSDPNAGRQSIEVDWNTTAEKFEDARDIAWPYQPDPKSLGRADDPHPGSDAAAQVDQTALAFMVENGPKGLFSMTALDTPGCRYGTDYNVSDVVRILVDTSFLPASMRDEDGVIRELVREVKISSSSDSIWTIEPTVGSADSSPTPYIYRQLKKLRKKVEDTSNRVEGDQTAGVKPYAPDMFVVTPEMGWAPATGRPASSRPPTNHNFVGTDRPLPWTSTNDSYVQLYVGSSGLIGDPRTPIMGQTECIFEFRSSEDGPWKPASQDQVYCDSTLPTSDPNYSATWFHNSNLGGGVNSVRYWRARLVNNGTYSAWSNVVKLTAANGSLKTTGTLTLSTPSPSTRHRWAKFNITGTDTTYGSLQLQTLINGTWFGVQSTVPTYTNNTFSFPYVLDDNAGTVTLRVQSFDNQACVPPAIKTSNTITLTVIDP